jgi:hypothetical protein
MGKSIGFVVWSTLALPSPTKGGEEKGALRSIKYGRGVR